MYSGEKCKVLFLIPVLYMAFPAHGHEVGNMVYVYASFGCLLPTHATALYVVDVRVITLADLTANVTAFN
jgi:hypothetical protein